MRVHSIFLVFSISQYDGSASATCALVLYYHATLPGTRYPYSTRYLW